MIGWIILIIIVIVLILFFHTEHTFRKAKWVILLIFLIILYFIISAWWNSGNAQFDSPKDSVNSIYSFVGFLGKTGLTIFDYGKTTVKTVGDVIKNNKTSNNEVIDGRR